MLDPKRPNATIQMMIGGMIGDDEDRQEKIEELLTDITNNKLDATQFSDYLLVKVKDVPEIREIVEKHGLYTNV